MQQQVFIDNEKSTSFQPTCYFIAFELHTGRAIAVIKILQIAIAVAICVGRIAFASAFQANV